MNRNTLSVPALALAAAACGGEEEADPALMDEGVVAEPMPADVATPAAGGGATATLTNAQGENVGTATFTPGADGVQVAIQVTGMPAGPHGVHIHATGQCDAPGFTTAGGHFNPTSTQHGLENPQGPHGGDMPQLEVGADGSGMVNFSNTLISLDAGPNSLFDADGAAVVVHAGADDQVTDPSGNSGDRVACGVVQQGMGGGM